MRELNIKIAGNKKLNPVVEVDGKSVPLSLNKFGNYEGKIQVEKDQVDIKVYRVLELNSKLWFLKYLFYYIISILGIFDVMREKKCIIIDCHLSLTLKGDEQSSILLTCKHMQNQSKAFEIKSNCEVQEHSNIFLIDKRAKRRKRLFGFVKFVVFIGVICGLIFGLSKLFGYI